MTFADMALLSLIAAVLSLDQMACFQVLLSRPICTAVIIGLIFGDVTDAAMVGICFEFLFVRSIPVKERAAADPTLATAAALAGMWGFTNGVAPSGMTFHPMVVAPFAMTLSLSAAFISKWFDVRLRNVNTLLSHRLQNVGMVQLVALSTLFAKSFALYLLTVLAIHGCLPHLMQVMGPSAPVAAAMAWAAFTCVCIAYASVPFFQGVAGVVWVGGLGFGVACVAAARLLNLPMLMVSVAVAVAFAVYLLTEVVRGREAR